MKRTIVFCSAALAVAAGAYAATAGDAGVTMSTDPAKAAEVERHAQELAARPGTSEATHSTKAKSSQSTKSAHKKSSTHHESSAHHAKKSTSKTASK
jgi:hypothetical protein